MSIKNVEKLDNSAVELTIAVDAQEFDAAIDKVYKAQRGQINVPGFRRGKAPRKVIEGMYGAGVFYQDAIEEVYPHAYSQAVAESGLDVVSYPSVEIVDMSKDGFTFKATVTIRPLAQIENYKGLSVARGEQTVTEADLEQELKPFLDRASSEITADRPAQLGDIVVLDYEGFKDGVPFDGGKADGHSLELGSGSFIPGFEDGVVGLSAGEEKDIELTFPTEYHAEELAGAAVVFHVKVQEVKARQIPELDDEFAKDVSEFETLAEFKQDLSDKIAARKAQQAEQDYESALIAKLVELMVVDIPDPMVDYQADKLVDDYSMRLANQGIPFDQYMQIMGTTRDEMKTQMKDAALRQIESRLALDAVAATEAIVISDEEAEIELAQMAEQYSMDAEKVREVVSMDELKGDLARRKAMDLVKEAAVAPAGE